MCSPAFSSNVWSFRDQFTQPDEATEGQPQSVEDGDLAKSVWMRALLILWLTNMKFRVFNTMVVRCFSFFLYLFSDFAGSQGSRIMLSKTTRWINGAAGENTGGRLQHFLWHPVTLAPGTGAVQRFLWLTDFASAALLLLTKFLVGYSYQIFFFFLKRINSTPKWSPKTSKLLIIRGWGAAGTLQRYC